MTQLEKRRAKEGLMPSLRSSFDDLFDMDRFFDGGLRWPAMTGKMLHVPATNIRELDNEFLVEVAAPGLNKKDFVVDIEDDVLEIKVEKEEEKKEKEEQYTRREYDYRAFYRSFTLPDSVQADKIKAEYKEGVLKVHLPKSADVKKKPAKQISIE